jgi:hypothetical protein
MLVHSRGLLGSLSSSSKQALAEVQRCGGYRVSRRGACAFWFTARVLRAFAAGGGAVVKVKQFRNVCTQKKGEKGVKKRGRLIFLVTAAALLPFFWQQVGSSGNWEN